MSGYMKECLLSVAKGDKDTVLKEKNQSPLRWLILALTCIMMIGNYYSYDIPAALNSQLDDYMGDPSDYESLFALLYTVYSVPNCFLPFFGGYFIDTLGVRLCLLVFASFICIGAAVFAFGVSIRSWPVMFLGRVLFGFGGESLGVGNSALLAMWFKGKELAFAFGLNLSIARLGSVMNNLVSPVIADEISIQFSFWFGSILCGGSIACVLFISLVDKTVDGLIQDNKTIVQPLLTNDDPDEEQVLLMQDADKSTDDKKEEIKPTFRDVLTFPHIFWVIVVSCVVVYGCVLPFNNIASSLLLERNYFIENPSDCYLTIPNQCESDSNQPIAACPTSDWYQPPLPVNITIDGTYYDVLKTTDIDCTDTKWSDSGKCGHYYCDRLTTAQKQSATIMSIPYIISACLSPFLGAVVDRVGKRAFVAAISPGILMIVHSFLGFSSVSPVGPLVGQGLAYAGFAAVLWPSIPLVIDSKFTGLGFGITTAIQNAGLALFPIIIAVIYTDSNDKYIPNDEVFFVSLAALGFIIGLYLNYYDYTHNSILNGVHKPAQTDDTVTSPINGVTENDTEKVKIFSSGKEI